MYFLYLFETVFYIFGLLYHNTEAEKAETEQTSKPAPDAGENPDGNKTEHSDEKTVEESKKESEEEGKYLLRGSCL